MLVASQSQDYLLLFQAEDDLDWLICIKERSHTIFKRRVTK